MVSYSDVHGSERFIVTQKNVSGNMVFYLYEVQNDCLKKLGSGRNPLELEDKFDVEKVLRSGKKV